MFLLILGILLMINVHAQPPDTFTTRRVRAEKATNDHAHYLAQTIYNQEVQEACNTTDKERFTNISSQLSIINNQWQQYGYGLYSIFDRETSEFIGFAGYHTVVVDELGTIDCFNSINPNNELEIYALLMPNYWHRGYGFEISTKLIDLAFEHLHYTSIIAYIEPKHAASLQLLKKLNFTEENQVTYNNKPHILYRLRKPST